MTKTPFTVNVNFAQITAKAHIYNTFDYEICEKLYEKNDEQNYPIVYNFLYKYLGILAKDKLPIIFSPDPAISASSIAANAEKYMSAQMEKDVVNYTSNLKIIYFTATPHLLEKYEHANVENFTNGIISNLICTEENTFTKHNLALNSNQFILIGINEDLTDPIQMEKLNKLDITYFTLKQMRKKGLVQIMELVKQLVSDNPIHVVFDMSVASIETAPCVTRFIDADKKEFCLSGFNGDEIITCMKNISCENVVGLDITGYDFRVETNEIIYRVTCEVAKLPLIHILGIKEKKINIFNENSKTLIWRPVDQVSHSDVGWFILRGVSNELREEIMKSIPDDTIIIFTLDDDDGNEMDAYISTTTMAEQEEKTYYDQTHEITDCVLFYEEKVHLMFEMLNTPQNNIQA